MGIDVIKRLTMEDFRGIETGSLDLSPITILLGANNSGKSTILEALFLGPNPCRVVPYNIPNFALNTPASALETVCFLHKTLDYRGYAFLLRNYTITSARIEFDIWRSRHSKRRQQRFRLFLHKSNDWIYVGCSKDLTYFLSTEREQNPPLASTLPKNSFARLALNHIHFETLYKKPFFDEVLLISPKLVTAAYEYMRYQWASIVNNRTSKRVADDASKFSFEHYKDFTMEPVIGGQLDLHVYLEDGRRIRVGDLGEGMQSYVVSRLLFELANPKILLWDDIESHLNPRILTNVADWFSDLVSQEKQVVVTTHSLEAAKAIAGINEESARICITSLQNSVLKVRSFSLHEIEKLQKTGIDARTAEAVLL
jgi:hypothetical protein